MYGGDSAYPPEPSLRFAIVSYSLPGSYRFMGRCHSGGGGGIPCRSPRKSVKKNILRISTEPKKSIFPDIAAGNFKKFREKMVIPY
jgi:hypothetical protein